ncbi:hypothetical protein SPHINGO391_450073 [Sphingomonas aurantiaca]|uniref:Uncharacterized protein n=1 Tax=Sphingomonas aurantiaca TaxID=185949 RepID=A0A5E7ZDK9_9SPHN|nr:hypothetical protein SPHINGO391_450073 [Sphingomonas aurantiaca]
MKGNPSLATFPNWAPAFAGVVLYLPNCLSRPYLTTDN